MSVKLIGTLSYDPKRDKVEFKKTHKMRTLIVNVRPGNLAQYYEKLIQDEFGPWAILRAPMFGYHVTVISGNEHVPNMNAWKKYEGKKIEVEYEIETLRKDRSFWNFRVSGTDQLREIRRELGLKPDYHFHLTIGREDTNYRIRELSSDDFEKLFDMIPVVGGNQELVKDESLYEMIFMRIISMLINEAVEAKRLGIANDEDIETAMQKGVNYPKGLLNWGKEIGFSKISEVLQNLYEEYQEERYRQSPLLRKLN